MSGGLRWAVLAAASCWVLVSARAPVASAASPDQAQLCTIHGDKVASPPRIMLGETVKVTLTLTPECPPAVYRKADVVLVIDRSLSMAEAGKLTAAKTAARAFVDASDLGLHRIGVVSFASDVFVAPMGLSQSRSTILQAIDDIEIRPGTNIAAAIEAAQALLASDGRPGALPVILLLSDGAPNSPAPDARAAAVVSANFAKLAGTQVFTIGLGADADAQLMQSIASSPQQYYYAPGNDQLTGIYQQIAIVVSSSVVKDLVLADDLYADVDLVAGTTLPTATVNGKQLGWASNLVPSTGLKWEYEVKPTRVGTYPTNARAVATFTNSDGARHEFVFPQPQITVIDPNVTPPCVRPAYTVMVHAFPDMVGVGPGGGCNNRLDGGDWMAGAVPALPELEFQLLSGGGQKVLFQGRALRGAGRIDQRLLIPVCEPPPYRLRIVSTDLAGWQTCLNSPAERLIPATAFQSRPFNSIEIRYGLVR